MKKNGLVTHVCVCAGGLCAGHAIAYPNCVTDGQRLPCADGNLDPHPRYHLNAGANRDRYGDEDAHAASGADLCRAIFNVYCGAFPHIPR